jgi:hypothetical protein
MRMSSSTVVDEPKLELGVCNDEPAHCGVLRCGCVQFQSDVGNSVVEFCANERRRCFSECCGSLGHGVINYGFVGGGGGWGNRYVTLISGDVLVVGALFCFCGGRKERGGELL